MTTFVLNFPPMKITEYFYLGRTVQACLSSMDELGHVDWRYDDAGTISCALNAELTSIGHLHIHVTYLGATVLAGAFRPRFLNLWKETTSLPLPLMSRPRVLKGGIK